MLLKYFNVVLVLWSCLSSISAQNVNNLAWKQYTKGANGIYAIHDFNKTKIANLAPNDSMVWYSAYLLDSMECIAELPRQWGILHKGFKKKQPEVTTYFVGFYYLNVIKYVLRYEKGKYLLRYSGTTYSPSTTFFAYNNSLSSEDNISKDRLERELIFINEIMLSDADVVSLAVMESMWEAYSHPKFNTKQATKLARYARLTSKGAANLYTIPNHAYDPHWIDLDLLQRYTPSVKSPFLQLSDPIFVIKALNRSTIFIKS